MSTNNICCYKQIDNGTLTKLLDCVLIGVCAVIRSNMVFKNINYLLMALAERHSGR